MRDRATFVAFARGERRRRGPLAVTRADPRTGHEHDPPRVAYQVGRRVGGAVQRNRVRRGLRAAIREHHELLAPGAAYLIAAGPGVTEWTGAELRRSLQQVLEDLEGART